MKELIPDKYNGYVHVEGNWDWSYSLYSPMQHYPDTLWLEGQHLGYIQYNPEIKAVGMVRISAYIIGFSERQDEKVEYEIYHNDELDKVYVNTAEYGMGQSDWKVLGTFYFSGNEKNEFVRLNRLNVDGITRASTLRFEIMNSALEDEVWQYLYVGPDRNNMKPIGLKTLNYFKDLNNSPYQMEIEQIALLEFIEKDSEYFKPDDLINSQTFLQWISKCQCIKDIRGNSEPLSVNNAMSLLKESSLQSGKNLEWMGDIHNLTAKQFLERAEVIPKQWKRGQDYLTRAEAAFLVKRYYHVLLASRATAEQWKLEFSDEFSGDVLDKNVWECQNEVPGHILSSRWESNVKVQDGKLYLLTKKEKHPKSPHLEWTTASVSVKKEVFSQCYGYWEASIKINAAQGLNNSFWMALPGGNFEIDVVEGHYPNIANTNFHIIDRNPKMRKQFTEKYKSNFVLSDDFHVYALEWNEEELVYYFDGIEISRKKNAGACVPVYPILSTAVLNWAGQIGDEADGEAMEIEWVRIYSDKKRRKQK